MAKNILVIAPHPDDETLGCAGTLLKHKAQGDTLYWLIITQAFTQDGFTQEFIDNREKEIADVHRAYGFKQVFKLNKRTAHLETYPLAQLISEIAEVIKQCDVEVLYLPHAGDVHSDHAAVFNAAWSCSKSFRFPTVKEVYCYETVSETEFAVPKAEKSFQPNTFVNITSFMEQKLEIAQLYPSEMAAHPFPRSKTNLTALAQLRGAITGCTFAEAFVCLKRVW